MKTLSKEQISKFLAFTVGSNSNFIDIDYLNSIKLSDNREMNIEYFKSEILNIFNTEIDSYNVVDGENIGLLLSGGLDSTLLLSILKDKFPSSKIYTYTLGYSSTDAHLAKAKKISEEYNTIHREVIYDLSSNLLETFDEIYKSGYDLEGEDSLIMNHILSKEVVKDCKIVFSGFGLDYIFAGMDLFRNSFMEKLYNKKLIDKSYIFNVLGGNKYYLKYVLDKINSPLGADFFVKYGEYYAYNLTENLQQFSNTYFKTSIGNIRNDISELKKQIYFIITTSLSNRYNPYNLPYEKLGVKHHNPFGSKNVISEVISLNIPDNFLYNPYTKEKKFIIREISKEKINSEILNNLHTGTVLNYEQSFRNNKSEILKLISENSRFLTNFFSRDFIENFDKVIEDSVWYENSKQIIVVLQMLFYVKNNQVVLYETSKIDQIVKEKVGDKILIK
ncbi:MAG: asparagine synthase C-terminal domain-containing protein [Candidatus Gracilibacteria bacterium]|nr:asparagine synthase C-terminal domain-containing protein [Candidatus Gracilibacteria bacterium]